MTPIERALQIASRQTDRNPSEAAKKAGNYAKGKFRWHSLPIAIENPKGSERSGIDPDGKPWSVKMPSAYGYFLKTEGRDGDHVDCYIGPDHDSDKVFIVDQIDHKTGHFDEHKCLLSYASKTDALKDYEKAFSDGKGKDRIGHVTEMSVDQLKDWLRHGNTKEPLAKGFASGGLVGDALKIAQKYRNYGTPYAGGGEVQRAPEVAQRYAQSPGEYLNSHPWQPAPGEDSQTTITPDLSNQLDAIARPHVNFLIQQLNKAFPDAPPHELSSRAWQMFYDHPSDDYLEMQKKLVRPTPY